MSDFKIGSIISFDRYEWRVLGIQNNMALIITEDIVETRECHDTQENITWADCEMRKYLNGEFYDRFSEFSQLRIIPITNKNPDNPWFGTNGGEDTQDKIFLLTIEDVVCRYFGDSSAKLYNRGKNENYWFSKNDKNNSKRLAKFMGHNYWWWLRSPGRLNRNAAYIHGAPGGCVGINGNGIANRKFAGTGVGGVRPTLWLKLEF